ncbi:methyltransferase [Candidatus Woesearchaeota archaeon]|nr:methyltransferase [Candidatus Woesearchaeota archaeon]
MNKKKLAIELSRLQHLIKFNVNLEQYESDSNIASELLWLAYQSGDINGKVVADFGCGNGILGIGALLLGAKFVYFLDSDKNALEVCKVNLLNFYSGENYELVLGDVSLFSKKVNTVIMNPPFGVQKRKADKSFLEVAMKYTDNIYSIHKIESKNFIEKLCEERDFAVQNIVERDFAIGKIYRFHKKEKHKFKVGIWTIKRNV